MQFYSEGLARLVAKINLHCKISPRYKVALSWTLWPPTSITFNCEIICSIHKGNFSVNKCHLKRFNLIRDCKAEPGSANKHVAIIERPIYSNYWMLKSALDSKTL